jgi:hypothetical protein
MIKTFLTRLTIIYTPLSLQAQLEPRFRAKAWLPFKNVKLVYSGKVALERGS